MLRHSLSLRLTATYSHRSASGERGRFLLPGPASCCSLLQSWPLRPGPVPNCALEENPARREPKNARGSLGQGRHHQPLSALLGCGGAGALSEHFPTSLAASASKSSPKPPLQSGSPCKQHFPPHPHYKLQPRGSVPEGCSTIAGVGRKEGGFPHVPACLDCFAGGSERKGLRQRCRSQSFPGQPWAGTGHRSLRPVTRGDSPCFLGWLRLLWTCLCHTGLRVSLVQALPPAPALACCVLTMQKLSSECERARVSVHQCLVVYPQRGFASQGSGKETPTLFCQETPPTMGGHPPAGPCLEGCALEWVYFQLSISVSELL